MTEKVFVLVDVEDKDDEEIVGTYATMDDAQDEVTNCYTDLKYLRIREYDLVKEHKLKLVTETVKVEKQVKRVVLK